MQQNGSPTIRQFLNANELYVQTMRLIGVCCQLNNVDDSHGLSHAIDIASHVYKAINSMSEEQRFKEQEMQNLMLAALLHDVDDRKYFKTINYKNARDILQKVVENEQRKQQIIRMIDLVSFSKNGNQIYPTDPTWYYFPRYADRLDAIGLIGLWRCYQYSFHNKNPFFTTNTTKPKTKQQLYELIKGRDQQYIKSGGKSDSVIDHMFDKILHIKLPISNPYLQSLYQGGHDYVVQYILHHATTEYINAESDLLQRVKKLKK